MRYWIDPNGPDAVFLSHEGRARWSVAPAFTAIRDLQTLRAAVRALRARGFRRSL